MVSQDLANEAPMDGDHPEEISMKRLASCCCGNLRIACAAEPTKVSLCHCLACQKRTGSTYGIAAFFRNEHVSATGRSSVYMRQGESGFSVTFHFCPGCGSTVFWKPQRAPELTAVAAGAFADPSFPKPAHAVHLETRHPWVGDL
jgi:hypothetical protein